MGLPHRLRYLLAWDHDLCRAVSGVAVRAVVALVARRVTRLVERRGLAGRAEDGDISSRVGCINLNDGHDIAGVRGQTSYSSSTSRLRI